MRGPADLEGFTRFAGGILANFDPFRGQQGVSEDLYADCSKSALQSIIIFDHLWATVFWRLPKPVTVRHSDTTSDPLDPMAAGPHHLIQHGSGVATSILPWGHQGIQHLQVLGARTPVRQSFPPWQRLLYIKRQQ